jgi:NAD(P)-dependent dehydrogenase (short-subunit alcohol dehydrogenase family)
MSALPDQVALITGGASGIGLAVAQRFVAEGCRVCVADINADGLTSLRKSMGDRVIGIEADVSTIEGNVAAVRVTMQAFGRLDVFVGNAGLFDGFAEFADLPIRAVHDGYHQICDLNVRGLLLGARATQPNHVRSWGSLIFTLSNSSLHPVGGGVMFVASKHAALGIVRQLAHELAPAVRVNGVAAGATRTPIRTAPVFSVPDSDYRSPEIDRAIEGLTPLAIRADPADHTGAYVLLASRSDGRVITGAVIETDAGLGVRGLRRTRGGDGLTQKFSDPSVA